MKWIKKALKVLRSSGLDIPPWVLLLILFLVGVGLAYWAYRKKNPKAPKAAPEAKDVGGEAPRAVQIGKGALLKVWRGFLRQIQPEYRENLPKFQPFVVLGASGSGKKTLISAYTDWEKRQQEYPFSQTEEGELEVYLAARAYLQLIPAKLLAESSAATHKALAMLWNHSFYQLDPVVVVAVSWLDIASANADAIRTLADRVRGRVNQLSMIRGRAIEVRVALTHLDQLTVEEARAGQISGMTTFSQFLKDAKISSVLYPEEQSADSLRTAFDEYQNYVQLALTSLSAEQYREVLSVLKTFPDRLERLSLFTSALYAADPLTLQPRPGGIYITSREGTAESPFRPKAQSVEEPRFGRLFWHKLAAVSVGLFGALFLFAGFALESQRYSLARELVSGNVESSAFDLDNFLERRGMGLFSLLPSYLSGASDDLKRRYVESYRNSVLMEKIRYPGRDYPKHKQLYLLSLFHSCGCSAENSPDCGAEGNELGKFVAQHLTRLEEPTGMSLEAMRRFLDYSRTASPAPAAPIFSQVKKSESISTTRTLVQESWEAPSLKVEESFELFLKRRRNSARELNQLKVSLSELLNGLRSAGDYREAPELHHLLENFSNCRPRAIAPSLTASILGGSSSAPTNRQGASAAQARSVYAQYFENIEDELKNQNFYTAYGPWIERVHAEIGQVTQVEYSPSTRLDILNQRLKDFYEQPPATKGMPDGPFDLDVAAVHEQVRRSLFRSSLNQFVELNSQAQIEEIFIAPEGVEVDAYRVELNPRTAGSAFFTGKKTIPGLYTRRGFENVILDQLRVFHQLKANFTDRCSVDEPDCPFAQDQALLNQAGDILHTALQKYAEQYARHLRSYWNAFGISAKNADELALVIDVLRLPVSPLSELIDHTVDNAHLSGDPLIDEYAPRMREQLAAFKPLDSLASASISFASDPGSADAAEDEAAPEAEKGNALATYIGILSRIYTRLQAQALGAPVGADGGAETLEQALSGSGAVALQMLRARRECSGGAAAAQEGAFDELVRTWLRDVRVEQSALRRPFLEPVKQLYLVGVQEIEANLARAWKRELSREVAPVLKKFPFDPGSEQEAFPQELERVLKAPDGSFYRMIHNYVEPVVRQQKSNGFKLCPGLYQRDLAVPQAALTLVEKVLALSNLLWDESGNPKAYEVTFEPEALPPGRNRTAIVSLAYLNAGESSLVYFNQRPSASRKALSFDWTQLNSARVGIRVTDAEKNEQFYPKAIGVEKRYWSLLKLLRKSSLAPDGSSSDQRPLRANEVRFSWPIRLAKKSGEQVRISFIAQKDPFREFRELARASEIWDAQP